MYLRKVKNKSNTSIQVAEKVLGKRKIVKHIGTARNVLELIELTKRGLKYIDDCRIKEGRISLFDNRFNESELKKLLSNVVFGKVMDTVSYNFFDFYYHFLGLDILKDNCFKDLVIARILNPTSKLETRNYLETKLNHKYSLTEIYRGMKKASDCGYKERIEDLLFDFVKTNISSVISVLFFDVTTLYYESFTEDDFRKNGFSKDKKSNQPQIVVSLTVTKQGFPVHMQAFEGNKFEGYTMLPVMQELIKKHSLKDIVLVADAGMLSKDNTDDLEAKNLKFIVGARLGNLDKTIFEKVTNVPKIDGQTERFELTKTKFLIINYSIKRANKDKSDREKQLKRANYALNNPSNLTKNYKFLKKEKGTKNEWKINEAKLQKAEQLEGLKGYVTNAQELSNTEIITKYQELWQVEKAFRITKSDLQARPIFHTVKEKILTHMLIVFTSLAITRYAEIKNSKSLKRILNLLSQIKEITVKDKVSGEQISKFTEIISEEQKELLKNTNLLSFTQGT